MLSGNIHSYSATFSSVCLVREVYSTIIYKPIVSPELLQIHYKQISPHISLSHPTINKKELEYYPNPCLLTV